MQELRNWVVAAVIVLAWGAAGVCTLALSRWVYDHLPWANPVGRWVTAHGGLFVFVTLTIQLLGWAEDGSLRAWLGDGQEGGDSAEKR